MNVWSHLAIDLFLQDISEFIEGKGLGPASDSEGEDEDNKVRTCHLSEYLFLTIFNS